MPGNEIPSDAYLDAFMNGFEFVLLAMRGRLAEADLPADDRARLERFLDDYRRVARAYHDRTAAPIPPAHLLRIHGNVPAEVEAVMKN